MEHFLVFDEKLNFYHNFYLSLCQLDRTYRVENGHEEGEDGAHVQVEHGLLLTVLGVDHDKVVVVDAGDADHQD